MNHTSLSKRMLLWSSVVVASLLFSFAGGSAPRNTPRALASEAHQEPNQATQAPQPTSAAPGPPPNLPEPPSTPPDPPAPAPLPTIDALPTIPPEPTPKPITSVPKPPSNKTASVPNKRAGKAAFVTVVARPISRFTRQGDAVDLAIVVTNRGAGGASNTRITLPLDPALVTVVSFTAQRRETWVSQHTPQSIEMQSGPLDANGGIVTATLRLVLHTEVAQGAPIVAAMPFTWSDDADGGHGVSNVPTASGTPGIYVLALSPQTGSAGTQLIVRSDIFAPDEPVFVWYNGPDGVVSAKSAFRTAEDGSLVISLDTTSLDPGAYSFVLYGFWTEFTATSPFTIE